MTFNNLKVSILSSIKFSDQFLDLTLISYRIIFQKKLSTRAVCMLTKYANVASESVNIEKSGFFTDSVILHGISIFKLLALED